MRTWLISMAQIGQESRCSERILKIISFFDNKGLLFELVRAAAGQIYEDDEILLAAGRLTDYSFFHLHKAVNEDLPTYEQHRLVQLATRRSLTNVESSSLYEEAIDIISRLFPNGVYGTWDQCILYLPHALKVAAWPEAQKYKQQVPILLAKVGRYYWEQGRYDAAERLEVEVLELQKEILGARHPDTIWAMANLAATWRQQGRNNEAERLEVEEIGRAHV